MSSHTIALTDAAIDDILCATQHPITKQHITGNALGQINTSFSDTTVTVGDAAVCALAFHPLATELAVAHDNELKIHDGTDYEKVTMHSAARFSMPITKVNYSSAGQHM